LSGGSSCAGRSGSRGGGRVAKIKEAGLRGLGGNGVLLLLLLLLLLLGLRARGSGRGRGKLLGGSCSRSGAGDSAGVKPAFAVIFVSDELFEG
jgi:hypothetical protein